MKTQVLQLDSHDDVISVRDKMSWAKTERILLVFPRRTRLLTQTLDLLLLQRHASHLGAQLAVVTNSAELRAAARKLGLPVFKTSATAQRMPWQVDAAPKKTSRRTAPPDLRRMRTAGFPTEPRWRSLFAYRLLFFGLAVLASLAVLSLFIPSAQIQLTPVNRLQTLTLTVSTDPDLTTVSLTGGVPAHLLLNVVEGTKTAPVTGSISAPDASAVGLVRFRNLTTGLVGIPAGTIIRTSNNPPIRFVTIRDEVVAAGFDNTVDVPVQALEAGLSGNLPADTLVAFEEVDLGTSLAVTNPDPTIGGTDRTAPIQTAVDRARLRTALLNELLDECQAAFQQMVAPGDVYLPDTRSVAQVLSETYFPTAGQTGETLLLTMNLQCQAQYASAAEVNALAEMVLNANLPDGFEPVSGGKPVLVSGTPVTGTDGQTRWQIQTQRLLQAKIDLQAVAQLVQSRGSVNAARLLSELLPLSTEPEIKLTPSWWPWLPSIPFRITISIVADR